MYIYYVYNMHRILDIYVHVLLVVLVWLSVERQGGTQETDLQGVGCEGEAPSQRAHQSPIGCVHWRLEHDGHFNVTPV